MAIQLVKYRDSLGEACSWRVGEVLVLKKKEYKVSQIGITFYGGVTTVAVYLGNEIYCEIPMTSVDEIYHRLEE